MKRKLLLLNECGMCGYDYNDHIKIPQDDDGTRWYCPNDPELEKSHLRKMLSRSLQHLDRPH